MISINKNKEESREQSLHWGRNIQVKSKKKLRVERRTRDVDQEEEGDKQTGKRETDKEKEDIWQGWQE